MSLNKKVDELKDKVEIDLRKNYKSIVDFRSKIDILMDTVEKLNEYTHKRIHYLTNTDRGVELVLMQLQEGYKKMQQDIKSIKDFGNDIKKRCIDAFFRILPSFTMTIIALIIGSHWLKR